MMTARKLASIEAQRPSLGMLVSMAIRYDHGLMMPRLHRASDGQIRDETPEEHTRRISSTLTTMKQIHEETSGRGFYSPEKEDDYAKLVIKRLKDDPWWSGEIAALSSSAEGAVPQNPQDKES